jgi:hypothetical protein
VTLRVLDTAYTLLEQAGGYLSNQGRGHQSSLDWVCISLCGCMFDVHVDLSVSFAFVYKKVSCSFLGKSDGERGSTQIYFIISLAT